MNTLFSLLTSLVNHSYSAAQWYSRSGHDQLVEILSVFGTVLFHLCSDGAALAQVTYQWLIDTFNSCDTNFTLVPPLSTEQGFITYPVIVSDLLGDWQRLSTPVKDGVGKMSAAVRIAMVVVKELL